MLSHGKVAKPSIPAKAAIKVVGSIKDIDKRTDAVVVSLKAQQHELHVLAVSVLIHVAKHGNIDVLTNFLNKVKDVKSIRNNALGNWFEKFGPVRFETDKDKGKGWKLVPEKRVAFMDATKDLKAQRAMLDACSATPFWMMAGQEGTAEYKPFDTTKGIDMLIGLLERDTKAATAAGVTDVDHSALLLTLKKAKVDQQSKAKAKEDASPLA